MKFLLFSALGVFAAECESPRLAYLILAHDAKTLKAAGRLLAKIYDADNWYVLHVDKKHQLNTTFDFPSNVDWGQEIDVQWARWSMVEPTLWAMGRLADKPWEFFINLSGDSWPVLTQPALKRRLAALPFNFVTSSTCPTGLRPTARSEFGDGWHKKSAYPETLPGGLEPYYGSQWMILQRDFVLHVLADVDGKAAGLRDWFVNGWIDIDGVGRVRPHVPDETFFPSLLVAWNFSVPKPVLDFKATFFIRMDEHYPWSSQQQRYASSLEKSERPWGPYYLGVYDLNDIRETGALFIRKTSKDVDPNLFTLLPVDAHDDIPPIAWPSNHNIKVNEAKKATSTGCVRVAESVHCPPQHNLRSDVADELR